MAQVVTLNEAVGVAGYANSNPEIAGLRPYPRVLDGATRKQYIKSVLCDTTGGGATVTITNFIPAGAFNIWVTARVITVIAGSDGIASWFFGISGADTDQFGAGLALAAGTTVTPANYTAFTPIGVGATASLLISGTGGKLIDSGQVKIDMWYELITAPTSA